LIIWWWKNCEK